MQMTVTLSPSPLPNASITWTVTPTPEHSLGAMALPYPSSEEADPVFISPSMLTAVPGDLQTMLCNDPVLPGPMTQG